jgi:transposase InsO family protein
MRAAGLPARVARVYRANPGVHRFYGQHPNRLPHDGARRPDEVWVGDITYLPVGGRWRFLAVVLDQYSRRVLAWTLGRRRRPPRGVIFHSDRGSGYAAAAFRDRLVAPGMRQSSAQRGPEDNAHVESFLSLAQGRSRPRDTVPDGGCAAARAPPIHALLQQPAPALGTGVLFAC